MYLAPLSPLSQHMGPSRIPAGALPHCMGVLFNMRCLLERSHIFAKILPEGRRARTGGQGILEIWSTANELAASQNAAV